MNCTLLVGRLELRCGYCVQLSLLEVVNDLLKLHKGLLGNFVYWFRFAYLAAFFRQIFAGGIQKSSQFIRVFTAISFDDEMQALTDDVQIRRG